MFNRVTYPVKILVLKFNLLSIKIFAFHLLTFILTLWYQMKIVPTGSFHHNLLSTSKRWHIWCFKNLQIILVFFITYLTILLYPEATICSFIVPYVFLCVRYFVHIFSFFFTSFTVICYRPNFILWMPFTIFFMSMVEMFVKSLVFAEVIPTMLTLGNRNHLFLIPNISPNHN